MKYTASHEWIRLEGKSATVGITKYAQKELGEIVHIELPKVGQVVHVGDEICVLESTKAAADIYSPATGKITAVNEDLKHSAELINKSPEERGWIYRMEPSEPLEEKMFLSHDQYLKLVMGK